MKLKLLLSLGFLFYFNYALSQSNMAGCTGITTTLTQCGGTFADPGGAGNYVNGANCTQTICTGFAGQCITLQFTAFNLENNFDYLRIYDGTTATTLLATLTGTTGPGNITSTTGCLTLVFTTDGSVVSSGWLANVICNPCGSPPPPPPGPIIASDCSGAVNICTHSSFQIDPSGGGSVTEFTTGSTVSNPGINPNGINAGCLLSGELNSTWMIVNIATNGTLEFSVGADGGFGCLDWIMWPYSSTACNSIINNTLAPVSCNWNGACESFTGMASPLPAGGDATNFQPELNVTCGQRFLICLSNYSSQSTSLPLNFFGTATISCSTFTPITVNSATICPGGNAVLTANGGNSYTWSPGGTLSATAGNPVTATPTTTTSYTVTGTGPCGTGTATAVVTVLPANDPLCAAACPATATNTGPYCVGQTIQLNGTGGGTYSWVGPSGFTSNLQNPTRPATATAAGNYTLTVTVGSCTSTATTVVVINNPVTPSFTAIPAICLGGSITLPTTSTNGITGTWSPAINNTATTTYTFTPTTGQCASTATMTVTVNTPTVPTFTAIAPICSGGIITLPTTSNNGITGTWSPAVNNTATTAYTFTPTAGLCATTTSMTVTVNTPTVPSFTAITPICSGGTINLPTTSTNGITGTWSPAVNNTATTTYTFTPTAGQCATTTTMTVNVGSPVTPTFTAIPPICSGGTITLPTTSTNAFTGIWSPAVNNTANTTYTFTPTAGQCATTTTMTVNVNNPVTPSFTAIAPICSGGNITLPTTSTNSFTGTWTPAVNNTATTTYTFTPTAGQCATTTTLSVDVNPIPVVDPITNISACPGDPIAASAYTSTPAGSTFEWTNSNTNIGLGAGATGNTPGFNSTNGTGSSITGTVSVIPTLNGCVGNPVTYTITVSDQLNATITPIGPFCESDASISMTAVDAGGTWTGTGITNGATGTFDPATAGPGTHTITYTIGGSCGDVQTTTITINPDMDATITAAGPFCTNDPAIALSAADAGGVWSGTGITNAALGIFDPSIAGNGTHTITYTIAGVCGDVQTINIIVSNQLNASINPVANVCEQDPSFNLTAVDAGGTWTGTGITNGATGTFNPATAGPGTHTITYTLGGNCGDVQTTAITVLPNMDATITAAGPFCTGNTSTTLTAVDAGGVWSGTGITNAATGTFDPATAGVGTHLITYTIPGQCGDIQTIEIVVVNNFDATINPVGPFCVNATTVDLNTVNGGGTFTGIGITNAVTGIFDPAIAGPGTHIITYTIPGTCGDVQTTTITVNPQPTVTFSVNNATGCIPVTATFTDNTGLAGSTVTWSMSDGFISTSTGSVTHTFNSVGCFDVTLQVTSAQGCTSSATQNSIVCVSEIPEAEFTWFPENTTITDPTVNFTNSSIGATIFNWDFDGLGTSTLTNPSFVFPNTAPGSYTVCLAVENSAGCVDSICHDIIIYDEFIVYVPNSFTPDNDGRNDIFLPVVSGHDPLSYELLIFNRWGELIFETEHSESGWDGTYKTVMSKEDTYVWKIKVKSAIDNKQHDFIGHVNLLK